MRALGRLVLGLLALAFAIPAGALTLMVGAMADPGLRDLAAALGLAGLTAAFDAAASGLPDATAFALLQAGALLLFLVCAVPPTLAALVGELFGARAVAWYGGASGVLTAALPWLLRAGRTGSGALAAEGRLTALLFVTGAASGLVYWRVAGRSAGRGAPEGRGTPAVP